MNIVPKVELSIDELFTKGWNTNMSMAQANTSIGSILSKLSHTFA